MLGPFRQANQCISYQGHLRGKVAIQRLSFIHCFSHSLHGLPCPSFLPRLLLVPACLQVPLLRSPSLPGRSPTSPLPRDHSSLGLKNVVSLPPGSLPRPLWLLCNDDKRILFTASFLVSLLHFIQSRCNEHLWFAGSLVRSMSER